MTTLSDLNLKHHANGHCVSTVALRVEHHNGMWFETYIFPSDGADITDWGEEWGTRYRTEDEAREGHDHVVALVERGELP